MCVFDRCLIGIAAIAFSCIAHAGRYDPDPNDGGGGFLLWIPLILAGVLYGRFEKTGNGKLAAIVGGGLGLAVIYFFPGFAALLVVAGFLLLVLGSLLNW